MGFLHYMSTSDNYFYISLSFCFSTAVLCYNQSKDLIDGVIIMKREEQRELKQLDKEVQQLIRKLKKEYDLQFAYESVYRFVGDYVYDASLSYVRSNHQDHIRVYFFIKPWVLNQTYWKVQKFNMEEMNRQPKTFQFCGAFTINDIYFEGWSVPCQSNLEDSVKDALASIVEAIDKHSTILKDIHVLAKTLPQYDVSNLTKAYLAVYEQRYDDVLQILDSEIEMGSDALVHADHNEKTAEDYLREYIINKEYLEIKHTVEQVVEVKE